MKHESRKKVPWKNSSHKKSPEKRSPGERFPQFGVCGIVGWALSIFWRVWGRRVGSIDKN